MRQTPQAAQNSRQAREGAQEEVLWTAAVRRAEHAVLAGHQPGTIEHHYARRIAPKFAAKICFAQIDALFWLILFALIPNYSFDALAIELWALFGAAHGPVSCRETFFIACYSKSLGAAGCIFWASTFFYNFPPLLYGVFLAEPKRGSGCKQWILP